MLGLWQTVPVTHWPLQPQQDPQDKVLTKSVLSTLRRYATPRLDWSFIWELMTLQSRCSVCGKQCLWRIGLSSHSKTHKIKSSPKVFCPHCEKVCNSKIGLWSHLRIHDSTEHILGVCGKRCMSHALASSSTASPTRQNPHQKWGHYLPST